MSERVVKVDYLARVEGEGALYLRVEDGRVAEARLEIFEPPRFFEAFLRGRHFSEAPDITSRICGICPVAYLMSTCHALEAAAGVRVDGALRLLRRLLYCGEWIESHVLHVAMLHAPDFLGYDDALQMAREHPDLVRRALRLKKLGNEIMRLLGGREIHPINVRVGGFYRVPTRAELTGLRRELEWGCEAARDLVDWTAGLPQPAFERDYEFVALRHESEYPMNEGRIVSNRGLDLGQDEFAERVVEHHVAHSTALQTTLDGRREYVVGPLARLNLNADRLTPLAADALQRVGRALPWRNPHAGIVARSIEVLFACEEALRLIAGYRPPAEPFVAVDPAGAVGRACTEAPRGTLYHRFAVGADGLLEEAHIIPPTAQNQRAMEEDLRQLAPPLLDLPDAALSWRCEQAVRNYDPCISCSTHYLKVHVERGRRGETVPRAVP